MSLILKQRGDNYRALIRPDMELYGFLGGLFGRDSYGVKTVRVVHDNYITAIDEHNVTMRSREIDGIIYTWKGIVELSNKAFDEGNYDGGDEYDND